MKIVVNDSKTLVVPAGGKLLGTLAGNGIFVSSACGGGGTCAQCKVRVLSGGGEILTTERTHISNAKAKQGYRLSCQVAVKTGHENRSPGRGLRNEKMGMQGSFESQCATFIKELVLELPKVRTLISKPGGYIQIEVPHTRFVTRTSKWTAVPRGLGQVQLVALRFKTWKILSFARIRWPNYPGERGIIMLNVELPLLRPVPPKEPHLEKSAYIFNLKPGDTVTISGPYGEFFIKDTDNEMVYIGGGAGMAPLRSNFRTFLQPQDEAKGFLLVWWS